MKTSEWFKKEIEELDEDIDSITYKYVLDFSENIYDVLDKRGVRNKNKFLAEKLNCSPAYITKIFNGKSNFTVKKMIEIARAIGYELKIEIKSQSENVNVVSGKNIKIPAGSSLTSVNPEKVNAPSGTVTCPIFNFIPEAA